MKEVPSNYQEKTQWQKSVLTNSKNVSSEQNEL